MRQTTVYGACEPLPEPPRPLIYSIWAFEEGDNNTVSFYDTAGTTPNNVTSIDWGDGTIESGVVYSHTYSEDVEFPILITVWRNGTFFHPVQANEIVQFDNRPTVGPVGMTLNTETMRIEKVPSELPEQFTNINTLLGGCARFNDPAVTEWDVSNITSMASLFNGCETFNQNINHWNVSKVTEFSAAFQSCREFNQPLNNWDVSSATAMQNMFDTCSAFNQDLDNWDVSNVRSIYYMFRACTSFNGNISTWDTSSLRGQALGSTFYGCFVFNGDISNWNISGVTTMGDTFRNCYVFDCDLSGWDVSSVTSFSQTFRNCYVFNGDISTWDTSSATSMNYMFGNAYVFNRDISSWNVSKVQTMNNTFDGAREFNQDISGWDVSSVTSMTSMFSNAWAFNQEIGTWNVSNVRNMASMFSMSGVGPAAFNANLNAWDVSNVTTFASMFYRCANYNQPMNNWVTSSVIATGMNSMFSMYNVTSVFNQDLTSWCVSTIPEEPSGFNTNGVLDESNKPVWGTCPGPSPFAVVVDTSLNITTSVTVTLPAQQSATIDWGDGTVETLTGFFGTFTETHTYETEGEFTVTIQPEGVDLEGIRVYPNVVRVIDWGTYVVRNFRFQGNASLVSIPNGLPDYVTSLNYMFSGCASFDQDVSQWDTSNITNLSYTFQNMDYNYDLSGWDTSNVTTMNRMFMGNTTFNQDISLWDVSSVTDMAAMFYNASSFSQDLSSWCVTNITSAPSLFSSGSALTTTQLPVWGTCPR